MPEKTSGNSRIQVTRKARFSAAHFFRLPELSDEENFKRFGPSANANGHGHNYELWVTASGPADPDTGMVVNLKDVKDLLDDEVVSLMDFKHLNLEVPYFKDKLPSLENMSLMVWDILKPALSKLSLQLDHIRIAESDDLFVDYAGEAA